MPNDYPQHDPIFVYQMGHVGSSSVTTSLRAIPALADSVFHTHWLTTDAVWSFRRGIMRDLFRLDLRMVRRAKWKLEALHDKRRAMATAKHPRFVTLVREPIARAVSTLFYENGHRYPGHLAEEDITELLRILERTRHFYEIPETWFESELEPVSGVSVYATPFTAEDRGRGYKVYEGDQASVLLIRTEDLDRCFPDAIEAFLGVRPKVLRHENTWKNKPYAVAYRQFQRQVKLPAAVVDRLMSTRWAHHFYSPEELDKARRRWLARHADPDGPSLGRSGRLAV